MKIFFNKYHGTGNDFIVIDNRSHLFDPARQQLIKFLCDRHFGIGADGLILLKQRDGYDFEMVYFNSDGKESTMCGNGGRCTVAFAKKIGIIESEARFMATDGEHSAVIDDEIISLQMMDVNPPLFVDGKHFINTGSPHLIIPVEDVAHTDVHELGSKYRYSESFAPQGTNVNFVQQLSKGIKVRSYERGVEAETLSCGTGVTAAAIASKWKNGPGNYSVAVSTPGGNLTVSFTATERLITSVWLKGPAKFVFNGEIDVKD